MTYPLRWFLPGVLYEITTRTIQERFLLRPGHRSRELIVGVIGRAQELYPAVQLHAFSYMSNHAHLLLSSSDGEQLALFLGFVNGQVARVMGRLHDWRGPFWGRRFRPIPALDAPSMIARLRYVMAQIGGNSGRGLAGAETKEDYQLGAISIEPSVRQVRSFLPGRRSVRASYSGRR